MILDQIQAGAGGKEKSDLPPAGKSLPLGPGVMMEPFLNDLKILTDSYADCNNTALTAKRMSYIIDLFSKASFCEDELDLEDLSLRLDKLYIDSGLSVRNTDTVLKKIRNSKTDERIKNGK